MTRWLNPLEQRAQPDLGVVFGGIADRTLGLPERELGRVGRMRERLS
jgi:hypothetical protein